MAPARPEGQLNLNLSSLSPIVEPSSGLLSKSPFGAPKSAGGLSGLAGARLGAGSPLHEQTSRLFPKRTRELATPTGASSNIWGPPTSGTSTPLFEIPESPDHDGFPDLLPLVESSINSPTRRARAGTLPSRISPVGTTANVHTLTSKTSRPTPSTSPFRPNSTSAAENAFNSVQASSPSTATLLSRLRAGSMPHRANNPTPISALGQPPFSSSWASRNRAATLTSIQSAEEVSSPQQIIQPRDGVHDPGVRTLDYLGLAESSHPMDDDFLRVDDLSTQQNISTSNMLANLNARSANRFRSFSVNTQPKYGAGTSETSMGVYSSVNGALTPSAEAQLQAEYQAVSEKVRLHNEAVQKFAMNASAARPRARTAGIVETPQRASLPRYEQSSESDLGGANVNASLLMASNTDLLADSFYDLGIGETMRHYETQDEMGMQLSRSLWIGSIPNSTTVSSLEAIFALYGQIESTRVLTHKNCGFVNYESIQDAVRARHDLNGKEIFPGGGPVRIGFAKAPNASLQLGAMQSLNTSGLSPDGNGNTKGSVYSPTDGHLNGDDIAQGNVPKDVSYSQSIVFSLSDSKSDILRIVDDLGSQQADLPVVDAIIEKAIECQDIQTDIVSIAEPSSSRTFDAPRLRDIRKRIDNGTCSVQEVEQVAIDMLPEIAELSADYLGNTVVQKLFEYCSDLVRDQMLVQIAPHLADIGVHKNGTWAAQKIIEVCNTHSQMSLIIDSLRPYTVPLFLDQYGNYVLQCCLKFGAPYNNFIFETMLSHLGEIAQGRFGARAMRACLESHHATKHQQRLLAATIAIQSVQLAVNSNGALLLTWLLDTCTFPRRRSALAPRVVPFMVKLCTHKVAYLTVLKIVNQRNEPDARDVVVKSLFFNADPAVLEQILSDQSSGVTLVFKILTNPFLDDHVRTEIIQNVANVLERIKAQPNQGYKRIMDEVGLSSRQSQATSQQFNNHGHPGTKQINNSGHMHYNGYAAGMGGHGYNAGANLGRTTSNESFGYPPYAMNQYQSPTQSYNTLPYQQVNTQNQYNNNNYQNQARNNNAFMSNNYNGYASSAQPPDAFRSMQNGNSNVLYSDQMSPLMTAAGYVHHGYGQGNTSANGYGFKPQNPGYYFNPQMQSVHAGGRGRRGN